VLVPDTVNVATLQPPAGAGNVVTVLVAGLTEILAVPGALIITIPEPPDPEGPPPLFQEAPPPPPPVLTVPGVCSWSWQVDILTPYLLLHLLLVLLNQQLLLNFDYHFHLLHHLHK
jgi:hypothetical protein